MGLASDTPQHDCVYRAFHAHRLNAPAKMFFTADFYPPYGFYTSETTPSHLPNTWTAMPESEPTTGPLGKRKRQRDIEDEHIPHSDAVTAAQQHARLPPYKSQLRSRPIKQTRLSPKLQKLPSHLMEHEIGLPESKLAAPGLHLQRTAEIDLRPCHICHSAPKRRRELENYLQCQACDKRACYICARQCSGKCGKQLCSKCCAEVGEEGATFCFGCI